MNNSHPASEKIDTGSEYLVVPAIGAWLILILSRMFEMAPGVTILSTLAAIVSCIFFIALDRAVHMPRALNENR